MILGRPLLILACLLLCGCGCDNEVPLTPDTILASVGDPHGPYYVECTSTDTMLFPTGDAWTVVALARVSGSGLLVVEQGNSSGGQFPKYGLIEDCDHVLFFDTRSELDEHLQSAGLVSLLDDAFLDASDICRRGVF